MKVCTFNVNSINARKNLIFAWLEHRGRDLDILCFQELKCISSQFPYQEFRERGYFCAVSGQKAYNGVAVCSKSKPEEVRPGMSADGEEEQKRMITVRFPKLTIINIYAPHGDSLGSEKFAAKQQWYADFLDHLKQFYTPDSPLMIMGDFNVAAEDRDIYDPEALKGAVGTMPEEREAFRRLLDWGLVDVFRRIHPEDSRFTWWDYRTAGIWRDEGMRIDYILVTPSLLPQFSAVEIDLWPRRRRTPTPSDHAPVIAELRSG